MQLPEWSSGIGKHMLKIEDGGYAIGNFRGPVVKFYQHWNGGRSVVCPGREVCNLCASPDEEARKASGRFRINFVVRSNPYQAMIFEGGKRVYEQLLQINKDIPLEKAWVRVSVLGKKKNKQTMLAIVPGENGIVKTEEDKSLAKVQLHDVSVNAPEVEADANEEAVPF